MQADRYSLTALAAAFYRAQHHLHDEPRLVDDPYAHRLLSAAEMAFFVERRVRDGLALGLPPGDVGAVLARTLRMATPAASVLVRARYAEDRLVRAVARGVGQYVLVGAGLDTFALRRTDLHEQLRVFELDHPRSQAAKRERLSAAGLAIPPNLHFGPVDFERQSVTDALGPLPFRPEAPAFFAWLGVTMYLTRPAIEATWRAMRAVAAPGSELVFDFIHPAALAANASAGMRRLLERTRAVGEPIITGIAPLGLDATLARAGWRLIEELDPGEIERRYFASRSDGYHAGRASHLAAATVA